MKITINHIDYKFDFVKDTKLKLVSKLTIKEFNYFLNWKDHLTRFGKISATKELKYQSTFRSGILYNCLPVINVDDTIEINFDYHRQILQS